MRKFRNLAAGIAVLALTNCSSSRNATRAFSFNLPKGKTYEYTMDMNMSQDVQGRKMTTDLKGVYSMQVTEENDSLKTVRTAFDRMVMNMDMGEMTMHVDTDNLDTATKISDGNDPSLVAGQVMNSMFRAMKGRSFIMKVNREGKVVSVTGMEEMGKAMINSLDIPEEGKAMAAQSFAGQFNDEKMKESFSQAFNIFPNKTIKVGDTWTRDYAMGNGISINSKYTVKAIEGDAVTLDLASDFVMGEAQGNMKGKQTGTMLVDHATGMILKGDMVQHFEGPMVMDMKMSYSGKEKK